jgi:hypothetical protein
MYVIKVCVYCDGHKHRPIVFFLSYFNGELFIPFHFVPDSWANIQFGREEKTTTTKKKDKVQLGREISINKKVLIHFTYARHVHDYLLESQVEIDKWHEKLIGKTVTFTINTL